MRAGLVPEVEPDQPSERRKPPHRPDVPQRQEWWPSFVGLDRAEPPGPGKPLTIIDTGVDLTHEEFATRPATTALNPQSTSARDEEHGTAVASTAAAPTNGVGIVGVYPQANLQVWDASPSGDGITAGDVIQGLDAAIRSGQGVVNLSLGSHVQNPLLDAMVAVTFASGTLVVAAAGNSREDGSPLEYPASLPHVLTAGAIDQSGQPTFFTSGSQFVDLAAPGWDIPVAVPSTYSPPHAGLRLLQRHELRLADRRRSDRLGLDGAADARHHAALRGHAPVRRRTSPASGFDPFSGFGRLDIPTALTAAPPASIRRSRTRT